MENFILKNEWDTSFLIEGTLEELAFYFDLEEEIEDIEDLLEEINDSNNGNGSMYYVVE
jgi:hypothetical protein